MKKNIPILIAGIVMALTTLLHLTGGQYDHIVPLLASNLEPTDKVVLLGVWHMASVILMLMAYWLLKYGLKPLANQTNISDGLYGLAQSSICICLYRCQYCPLDICTAVDPVSSNWNVDSRWLKETI